MTDVKHPPLIKPESVFETNIQVYCGYIIIALTYFHSLQIKKAQANQPSQTKNKQ